MKNRSYAVGWLFLALTSLGWGQTVTCANKWCGPYSVPMSGCLSGTSETNGCLNTTFLQIGFATTSPSGSGGSSFQALTAVEIGTSSVGPDVVPNGSVGLKQYMQFANNHVQAYSKTNDGPIFSNNGTPKPQPANSPWTNGPHKPTLGPGYCGQQTVDFDVAYDRANSIWVLAGTSIVTSGTNSGHRDICIATSVGDDLYNSGTSYWNSYAFDLTNPSNTIFLPINNGVYDRADYARFGTWKDGYYVAFDFINQGSVHPNQIDGFAVCKLDQANIKAGNPASAATCYAYIPTAAPPMIHTLLPADMESAGTPATTAGEFFLATVNPGTDGSPCTTTIPPCTSNSLAFWTWSEIVSESAPTAVSVTTFTPGCYSVGNPANTFCVPQPGTANKVDSVGDRLMSRLAYRYVVLPTCTPGWCEGEYLAVTQTVQEDSTTQRTGVRYYTIEAPSSTPIVRYQGDIKDSNNNQFYWMPSNAIDKNGVVGYTLAVGDASTTHPSVAADTLDGSGSLGTPTIVQAGSGSITDTSNQHWGEYVSTSIDPSDDLTFWSTGQYLPSDESPCDQGTKSGCNWLTQVFYCMKGSGFCL